ncbi:MAG: tyrosine-type recombinase/integrase [Chloroflexota bacterium]|nr:tyrosine-type recombinase/integrase [Chloroflexota bacterium]
MPSSTRRRSLTMKGRPGNMEHLTFSDLTRIYLRHQESRNLSPATIRAYEETFKVFEEFAGARGVTLTPAALTTDLMHDFYGWLKATPLKKPRHGSRVRSAAGTATRMRSMRAFVNFLADEGYVHQRVKVQDPAVPKRLFPVFSDDELQTIFACRYLAGDSEGAVRNRAIISLLLDSGLRLAELCGISLVDLYLEDRLVRVTGKGSKTRFVPYSATVARSLQEWLVVRGRHPGSLFELATTGVQSLCRYISRETGVSVHPHKFRHTAATRMVRGGMDLHTTKRILGHAHIETTELYLSLSNEDIRDKHDAVSPMAHFEDRHATRVIKRRRLEPRRRARMVRGTYAG